LSEKATLRDILMAITPACWGPHSYALLIHF